MVGVVRIHSDSIYESGEYAILLRSDLKGRGLGWALMQLIIEYAKSEGLKMISGQVLQDNTVMLEMCRELGFAVKSEPVGSIALRCEADTSNAFEGDRQSTVGAQALVRRCLSCGLDYFCFAVDAAAGTGFTAVFSGF